MIKNLRRSLLLLLVLAVASIDLKSQILPEEGRALNYRIIGFTFPASQKKDKYKVEIASGNFNDEISFKNNIAETFFSDTNKVIAEVPSFGSLYTWRVVYNDGSLNAQNSVLRHFSTLSTPWVDTLNMRLRILKKAAKHKDAFVFLDAPYTLYDMDGHPVWFLPQINNTDSNQVVRDLKLSPQGTATFVMTDNVYEVNYNGKVLWKGPHDKQLLSADTAAPYYHHQVTRLSNGHYMVLGSEFIYWKIDSASNSYIFLPQDKAVENNKPNSKMEFGTVLEYDEAGHLVWEWRSADYYTKDKKFYQHIPKGMGDNATHENAFFFDEKNKNVYISFKNTNQILKVKYPGGNVINAYGQFSHPGTVDSSNNLFCMQHSCNISQDGYLYMFNNNRCHINEKPQIVIFREPLAKNGDLKKIWSYEKENIFDTSIMNKQKQLLFQWSHTTLGGNVAELPDRSIFASVCSPYADVFIVSRDKKLLWDAIPEKWNDRLKKWMIAPQYRANIIKSRKELEQFIWSQEK